MGYNGGGYVNKLVAVLVVPTRRAITLDTTIVNANTSDSYVTLGG